MVETHFEAQVIYWRGPAPFFFVALPASCAELVKAAASAVSYGWGMVPVEVTIGGVAFRTALFPRDGTYYLPLKDTVRKKVDISVDDRIAVDLIVRATRRAPGKA